MNVKYKKSLKFVSLAVMALVIATVSANVYSYMGIDGGVIIGTQKLVWLAGSDAPAGTTTTGATAVVNFNVEPDLSLIHI